MAVADEIVAIACEVKPDQVTLVPERRQVRRPRAVSTSSATATRVTAAVAKLAENDIPVSLFIAADKRQVDMHARGRHRRHRAAHRQRLRRRMPPRRGTSPTPGRHAPRRGRTAPGRLGLHVHMGHGLDTINVVDIVRIPGVEEFNIGFSIIAAGGVPGAGAGGSRRDERLTIRSRKVDRHSVTVLRRSRNRQFGDLEFSSGNGSMRGVASRPNRRGATVYLTAPLACSR